MFSWKRISDKAAWGISIAVMAIVAMRFYYVREMFAALVLFSALFACVAAALVLLFIIDRATRAASEFIEVRGKQALQHAVAWRSLLQPGPKLQR